MALNTCGSLGYEYGDSFCLPVGVFEEESEFTVDTGWIVGASFLGLILGAALVLLLARPFYAAWKKKKQQDEEYMLQNTGKSKFEEAKAVNGWVDNDSAKPIVLKGKDKKPFFRASRFRRKKKENVNDKDTSDIKPDDVDPALARGMVDIAVQSNSASSEVEMADQDMAAIISMEKGMEEEKEILMLRTLSFLLKKNMEKRLITQNFYTNFMKKTEEETKDLSKMIDRGKEEAEEQLRNDAQFNKNSQALETEMQKLQTHFSNKQSKLQRDYRDKIRLDLLRSSGMSEAEVDDVMDKLMKNMAMVEEKLGLEQARQRRALEQRLAKRRQAMEFKEAEDAETENDIEMRVDILKELINGQLKDGSVLEKQSDDITSEYGNELDVIRKYYRKEYDGLIWEKFDFLQQGRLHKVYKLSKKQEKEKAAVLQTADKSNAVDFIKLYHDLMTKHHIEQESLCAELDQKEVIEMHKVKESVNKEEMKALDRETEKLTDKLESTANMTVSEAERIIKLHKQQMANCNARRQKERQALLARLEERMQQRLAAADEAEARDQKEQETLKEEQMNTMNKVLTTNMDLTQEAKERVLREHEQNMQALSNQLLRSKIRQQKSLEIKLNQRKVKLAELKQEQKEMQTSTKGKKEKDKEAANTKLADEIAKEEREFEEARKTAVADLRRQLAEETKEALKLQDEEIGLLIGRLQVGQARRKAIIERQDATLKQLQNEVETRMASEKTPSSMTDQIIQQHYNQVSNLNDRIQRRRENQEKIIMDKLASKRQYMEEDIETKLEADAQSEYTECQQRGAGYASLALMQSFLEQRHAHAMQDLETEMQAELEKSKSDLNMELEQELKKELEAQKENLLTQLAVATKMSKGDIQRAVSATRRDGPEKGQSDAQALRLARDLRENMERSKTSVPLDNAGNRQDDRGFRRTNTDLNSSQGFGEKKPRKGSALGGSRRGSAKQAFTTFEEDNEF